jgi:hypothetical protein
MADDTLTIKKPSANKFPLHGWAILSYALIIVIVALLVFTFTGSNATGEIITNDEFKLEAENFINTQLTRTGGATITEIKEDSGIYTTTTLLDGKPVDLYFTTDGKFIIQGTPLISLSDPNSPFLKNQQQIEQNNAETTEQEEMNESESP